MTHYAVATGYLDGGVKVTNAFKSGDTLALGVSYTLFGNDYLDTVADVTDSETMIEMTYQFPIADHFTLQPDLQYILDPHESSRNPIIMGVRAIFEFSKRPVCF